MAAPAWQVQGQYYETCNCDFVCPCVPAQLAVMPTKGSCLFAMAFQIEKGRYDRVLARRSRIHPPRVHAR